MVSEIEVEHAVSSADDAGEVEIEQAYIEHQLGNTWAARGGLFLIPVGLLNENHEPTAYFGVFRNFVETVDHPDHLARRRPADDRPVRQRPHAADRRLPPVSTSPSGTPRPTRARSRRWARSTRSCRWPRQPTCRSSEPLNWRGIPGLLVGGSVFTGDATQRQSVATSRVTLWDMHARWTPGRWDLSALYTRGTISNTAALNAPLVGNPTLIPGVVRRLLRAVGLQAVDASRTTRCGRSRAGSASTPARAMPTSAPD